MLALRLPPDIEARLEALAKKTGRTKSHLAQKRYALIEKGKSKTLSLDEVEAQLGVGG